MSSSEFNVTPFSATDPVKAAITSVGGASAGGTASSNKPIITGTGEPGQVVNLYDGARWLGSTTVASDGTWSITATTALKAGKHSFTAIGVGADGVNGLASEPLSVTVPADTPTIPPTPVIGAITDHFGPVQGNVAPGGSTDDPKPIISGSGARPGDIVTIKDGSTPIGSAIVKSDGTWSVTPDVSLSNGPHSITAVEKNPSTGATSSPSTAVPIIVDTTVPNPPSIGNITDPSTGGNVPSGGTTGNPSPVISGSGKPGDIVIVTDGDTPIGSTVVDANGNWSITPNPPLGNGSHNIAAVEKNPATGATSTPSPGTSINVDTSVPTAPVIGGVTDNVGPVTGSIASGGTTDDTQPIISGSGAKPGDIVIIKDGSTPIGSAIVKPDGTWSVTPDASLSNGSHNITATEKNPATGATGPASAVYPITVDTTTPTAPTISSLVDHTGAIQGNIANGGTTDETKPIISGSGTKSGDIVTISDNGTIIGSATVDANGKWTFTPTTALVAGSHNITAVEKNPATGAFSTTSTGFGFTIAPDALPPSQTPVISGVTDNVGLHTGAIANGGRTDDTKPVINGTGHAGDVITVKDGNTVLGSTTVNGSGIWSFQPATALPNGNHDLTATAAGNGQATSAVSPHFTFTLGTDLPTIDYLVDAVGPVTGNVASGGTTDDANATLKGTGPANSTFHVYEGGTKLGDAQIDSTGHWSFKLTNVTAGTHTYQGYAESVSGDSNSFTATFAALPAPPTPTLTQVDDYVGPVQGLGAIWPNTTTDDPQAVFRGNNAGAGNIVKVYDNGTLIGSTTADNSGNWTFKPATAMTNGAHDMTFTATKPSTGAVSATSSAFHYTVDTTLPATPHLTQVDDHVGPNQGLGAIWPNTTTDDPQATFRGDSVSAGNIVKVYDNGNLIGSTTADSSGNWSFTPANPMTNGAHDMTFTATKTSTGAVSATSGAFHYTIDTTLPATPHLTQVDDHVGPYQGLGAISPNTTTDDPQATFRGDSVSAGNIVKVYDNGNLIGSTTADSSGNWSFTPANPMANGAHDMTFTATKSSTGAVSATSGAFHYTIDTTVPAPQTPTITGLWDQSGPIQGNILAKAGNVDDQWMTLTGTGHAGDIIVWKSNSDNGYTLGSAVVASNGTWSIRPANMLPTNYIFTGMIATAVNSRGQASQPVSVNNFVDGKSEGLVLGPDASSAGGADSYGSWLIANSAPVPLNITSVSGQNNRPTIAGTARKYGAVHIWLDGNRIGAVGADASGHFTYTVPDSLPSGQHTLSVTFSLLNEPSGPSTGTTTTLPYTVYSTFSAPIVMDAPVSHTDALAAASAHDDSTTTPHHTVDANGAFTGTTANETVDLNVDPQAYFAKASAHIAGGGGVDTIALTGDHQILDLTSLTGKTATAKISGVEVFDLGGHQNTLKVSLLDVLNLGEKDLFVHDGKQQVAVKGAAGDAVDLSNTHVAGVADGQWAQHGTAQVGGVTYAVYEHSGAHVELLVQQGVATTVHQ